MKNIVELVKWEGKWLVSLHCRSFERSFKLWDTMTFPTIWSARFCRNSSSLRCLLMNLNNRRRREPKFFLFRRIPNLMCMVQMHTVQAMVRCQSFLLGQVRMYLSLQHPSSPPNLWSLFSPRNCFWRAWELPEHTIAPNG